MNYSDKNKNDKLELDELNIKSHLNTSLDLSGISVSEDLINRTLAAIKEQSISDKEEDTTTKTTEPSKKIIVWNRYVRGFAGVAAAIILVVIGYNVVQQMPMGMKSAKDLATPELTSLADSSEEMAASGVAPDAESNTFDANLAMEKSEDIQFTITAEAGALPEEDSNVTFGEGVDDNVSADQNEMADTKESENTARSLVPTEEFSAKSGNSDEMITYSFREIFIPTPEQAEYITITDNRSNTSITLTKLDDIKEFYILMDSHQFTEAENNSLYDTNYTVKVNSPELGTLFTMVVSSNLTVSYKQGENTIETVYYAIDDATFKRELEEFFNTMSR